MEVIELGELETSTEDAVLVVDVGADTGVEDLPVTAVDVGELDDPVDDDATDELEDVVLVAGAAADDVGELPEVSDIVVELDDLGVNQTNGSSYSVVVEDVVAGVVEATEMVELD